VHRIGEDTWRRGGHTAASDARSRETRIAEAEEGEANERAETRKRQVSGVRRQASGVKAAEERKRGACNMNAPLLD
jgi:hypothetical protein